MYSRFNFKEIFQEDLYAIFENPLDYLKFIDAFLGPLYENEFSREEILKTRTL